MPRIAIGEISHETNTFCPPTTLAMFKERHWDHGVEIIKRERGTRTYLGGMIDLKASERSGRTVYTDQDFDERGLGAGDFMAQAQGMDSLVELAGACL